jgi:hypothetical protein
METTLHERDGGSPIPLKMARLETACNTDHLMGTVEKFIMKILVVERLSTRVHHTHLQCQEHAPGRAVVFFRVVQLMGNCQTF